MKEDAAIIEMKVPVSVVIVTRNEEKNIENALESVKDFEDIVVVDSFSEDRTVEICKKYTQRVYQHEWEGFAKQKQMAVDYAKNQWVLILDADERVTPELRSEIVEKIENSSVGGFYLPRKNFFLGRWIKHGGWWPDHTLRLFRKDISYMQQREVHEKVVVNGLLGYLKKPVEHYTYDTISDFIKKMENYSTLSVKELSDKGDKTSIISMLVNPVFVFIKMFFLRQGFRDGIHGFILAVLYGFYTFLKYAKLWEKKKKR
jgi:glycosyltransferase involved in cell wall biosynthesis